MSTTSKKNGLIELLRFLLSVWVAYYHGFLPVLSDKFNGVNVSVDFFFIISGLFFLKSVEKHKDKPYLKGAVAVVWDRAKRLIVPLVIAACSILLCNIMFPMSFAGFNWPLSFLWFFAAQYSFLPLFFMLYKKIKKRAVFNVACVIIVLISFSLFKLDIYMFNPFFRTPGMLAFGILVSQVPKIQLKLKNEEIAKKATKILNITGLLIFTAIFIYLSYLPGYTMWKLHLSCCLVCPILAYFMTAVPVHSKILNFLGDFSLYIYLAQCPMLLRHYIMGGPINDQFQALCICAVALFVLNKLVNMKKRSKSLA